MPTYYDILGYPDTDGFFHSWASVEIAIAGVQKVVATKSLRYRDPLQIGKVYGTSARKIGRTRGQSDPTGTWEVYRSSWDMIMADVLAVGGRTGFAESKFPITVSYGEPSNPLLTVSDVLLGARIHSPEGGGQEGTDALTVTFELDMMDIMWGKGKLAPGFFQLSPFGSMIPAAA